MSDGRNRGRIIWVLASSRPDLIEIDLKRPGRVDVKIPIFPTSTPQEGYGLLSALCKKYGTPLGDDDFTSLEKLIPDWLTPGAAETLAVKTLRGVLTEKSTSLEIMRRNLTDYHSPIASEIMAAQIQLAVNEASDWDFVPPAFRSFRKS
jgi:SpoVK/Ycf46/Vps4 family AAA+-type ATPase